MSSSLVTSEPLRCCFQAARVKEAEQAYRKGREVENRLKGPRHIGAYRVLASMYQGMGHHRRAIDYLGEALDEPDNDQVRLTVMLLWLPICSVFLQCC